MPNVPLTTDYYTLSDTCKLLTNVGTPSPQLLSHLVKLYLSFLAIRNIPILEAMYR
jgi:hypothetical protein